MALGLRRERIFRAWVALELNLARFLFILALSSREPSRGAGVKYFIMQRLGSVAFFIGAMLGGLRGMERATRIAVMALRFKLGAAPFHFWMLGLVRDIGWHQFLLVRTVQKILPLFLVMELGGHFLLWLALLGAGGALSAFVTRPLIPIIVYSSVLGMAWRFASLSREVALLLLLAYRRGLRVFVLEANQQGVDGACDEGVIKNSPLGRMLIGLALFRIAGVPPFLGFYVKICVLRRAVGHRLLLRGLLLFSSLLFVFIYLRVVVPPLSGATGIKEGRLAQSSRSRRVLGIILLGPLLVFFLYMCNLNFDFTEDRAAYHT